MAANLQNCIVSSVCMIETQERNNKATKFCAARHLSWMHAVHILGVNRTMVDNVFELSLWLMANVGYAMESGPCRTKYHTFRTGIIVNVMILFPKFQYSLKVINLEVVLLQPTSLLEMEQSCNIKTWTPSDNVSLRWVGPQNCLLWSAIMSFFWKVILWKMHGF